MSLPQTKLLQILSDFSLLPRKSFQTKTPNTTSILHARLIITGLSPPLNGLNLLVSNTPNPSPFNALIAAFARRGLPSLALQTLSLIHRLPLPLDSYALCSALTAASITPAKPGSQIHAYASKSGWMSSVFVCGALIDFYVKVGNLDNARQLFDEIPLKNTVCFNALLSGHGERGLCAQGMWLLRGMHGLGLKPDGVTLSAALRICAESAVVELGVQVHACVVRRIDGVERDAMLSSSLVEMYGKCGFVGKARLVFELAGRATGRGGRDVVLWTSMLNAYGRNGRFSEVIEAYEAMLVEGNEPDELAFLAVLSACSRCGCVTDGLKYFESMGREYGIAPNPEHFGCVVDMLCRAGDLEKAWNFANEMVLEDCRGGGTGVGISVWGALLSACKDHGNVEIGKVAAQRALELDPSNVGIYIELSNLYASLGLWGEIGELRELIKGRGLKKDVGCSWLGLK